MKRTILLLVAILYGTFIFSQQKISIKKPATGTILTPEATINGKIVDVKKLDTKKDIDINYDPALTGINHDLVNDKGGDLNGQMTTKDKIVGISTGPSMKLTIKATGYTDLIIDNIGASPKVGGVKPAGKVSSGNPINAREFLTKKFRSPPSFHDLKSLVESNIRYNSRRDEAFIILDENGRLIGNVPVNLDQDDIINIYLVVDKKDVDKYDIGIVGGQYSQVDLQIRNYEPINKDALTTQGSKPANDWAVIRFERGPYTSENVTFNIQKTDNNENNNLETKILSTYTVNINELYHVGIGASFISTNLSNPEFDVFPINGANTINAINNGDRSMLTFNVIWYWHNTFKYLRKGDNLTRGRDVLKEPDFFTRLNPTFGVALAEDFGENYFAGLTYEFARGGSIVLGWHYGEVNRLATTAQDGTAFVLGESIYSGTVDDIKITKEWKWGFFFGITLDTRIFNKLLTQN